MKQNVQWQIIRDAGDYSFPQTRCTETPDAPILSVPILFMTFICVHMQCDEHGQVRERPKGDSKPGDPEGETADLLFNHSVLAPIVVTDNRRVVLSHSLSSGPAGAGGTGGTEAGSR